MPHNSEITPQKIARLKEKQEVRQLIRLLAHPGPHHALVMQAVEELGALAAPALVQVLEIEEQGADLLADAASLLQRIRFREAVPFLGRLLFRGRSWFKALAGGERLWGVAVDTLGALGGGEAFAILDALIRDPALSLPERKRVVRAIAETDSGRLRERLAELWSEFDDREMKRAVLTGLVRLGVPARGHITRLYQAGGFKEDIIDLIGRMRAGDFLPLLIEWLEREPVETARRVLWALGEIGDRRAYAPIKLGFYAFPVEVRFEAVQVLMKLGWEPTADTPEEMGHHYRIACALPSSPPEPHAGEAGSLTRAFQGQGEALKSLLLSLAAAQERENESVAGVLQALPEETVAEGIRTLTEERSLSKQVQLLLAALRRKLKPAG